ncbi:MAG TPA: formyltransferase family protein [Gemmatimonadaceae bacterium]|nr:formyltransferase family protein [Gemmatimonadaceae bacterium]
MTAPAAPLPPLPRTPQAPLRVVVLTCYDFAWETARALLDAPGVELVAVVQSAPRRRKLKARLRTLYRTEGGALGLLMALARKAVARVVGLLRRSTRGAGEGGAPAAAGPIDGVTHVRVADFHAPDALASLAALAPDLAIVDGTYILKEPVFALPRFGSINLHCGKLPFYRGAPPAFWELYQGEREVGVTIHRVTAGLDAGPMLAQEVFPLDDAPPGDPVAYVRDVWLRVLRPNGVRMLAECASWIAAGAAEPRIQPPGVGSTYRSPDRQAIAELRARVAARRAERRATA